MAKDNPLLRGLAQANASAVTPKTQPAPSDGRSPSRTATRQGTKLVGAHFPTEVSVALKVIAAQERTTVQDLVAEGINVIFAKFGKPQIAPIRSREGA